MSPRHFPCESFPSFLFSHVPSHFQSFWTHTLIFSFNPLQRKHGMLEGKKCKAVEYVFYVLIGETVENSDKKREKNSSTLCVALGPSFSPLLSAWESDLHPGGPGLPTAPWVTYFPHFLSGELLPAGRVPSLEGTAPIQQPSHRGSLSKSQEVPPTPNPAGLGWVWGLHWAAVPSFTCMEQTVPEHSLFRSLSRRLSSLSCWNLEQYNYNYYPQISTDKLLFMTLCRGNSSSIILGMHLDILFFPTYLNLWEWSHLNKTLLTPKDDFIDYILFQCGYNVNLF